MHLGLFQILGFFHWLIIIIIFKFQKAEKDGECLFLRVNIKKNELTFL